MTRGTTPLNRFSTPADLRGATVYVTYSQNGHVKLEKSGEEIEIFEDCVMVQLSQEETLVFDPHTKLKMQVRYVFPDGSAGASDIVTTHVDDILMDGAAPFVA